MYMLLILIATIFVKYNESCKCYKCSTGWILASSIDFKNEGNCVNNLRDDQTQNCMFGDCITAMWIRYDVTDNHNRLRVNLPIKPPEYRTKRYCSEHVMPVKCEYSKIQTILTLHCIRTSAYYKGNDISLSSIYSQEIKNIYELCASCNYNKELNCENEISNYQICFGGKCFITLTINDLSKNRYTSIRRGCLLNYNHRTRVIELQKTINKIDTVYPNTGKAIELWAICKPKVKYICNNQEFKLKSLRIDPDILNQSTQIYEDMVDWNNCIYCYSDTQNSSCGKGKIDHKDTGVIVCNGPCSLVFIILQNKEFKIARSCNLKRHRKIGGLNPKVETLINYNTKNGCYEMENKTELCKVECNKDEQIRDFCNRWSINNLRYTDLKKLINERNILSQKNITGIKYNNISETKKLDNTSSIIHYNHDEAMKDIFYGDHNVLVNNEYYRKQTQISYTDKNNKRVEKINKKRVYLYYSLPLILCITFFGIIYTLNIVKKSYSKQLKEYLAGKDTKKDGHFSSITVLESSMIVPYSSSHKNIEYK